MTRGNQRLLNKFTISLTDPRYNGLQLVHLLERCPLESDVTMMSAAALARVLLARKVTTLSSLNELDILSILARAIKTQQHSTNGAKVCSSGSTRWTLSLELALSSLACCNPKSVLEPRLETMIYEQYSSEAMVCVTKVEALECCTCFVLLVFMIPESSRPKQGRFPQLLHQSSKPCTKFPTESSSKVSVAAQARILEEDDELLDGPSDSQMAFDESRFALLNLLNALFAASGKMQRQAIQKWEPISALFCLLPDSLMRPTALKLV